MRLKIENVRKLTPGYIYLLQLYPKEAPALFKIGYSENPETRILQGQCFCPNIKLVSLWAGSRSTEAVLLHHCRKAGFLVEGDRKNKTTVEVLSWKGTEDELKDWIEAILNGDGQNMMDPIRENEL